MHQRSIFSQEYQPAAAVAVAPYEPMGLRSLGFSTSEVAEVERFAVWRDVYSAAVDLFPVQESASFFARHRTWDLGSMAFQTVDSDSLRFTSLAGHTCRNPLDHWVVAVFVAGSCVVEGSGTVVANAMSSPLVVSLAHRFEGRATHSRAHILYIPRDTCRDSAHLLDSASLSLLPAGMGGIFADYMLSLESRMEQLQSADVADLVAATHALLLAAIAPSPGRLEEAGALINHALLERARQCVQDNLRNPALDVPFILRCLGVSRSRLYRLFEASGGIMHYIQKRRLVAAHKVLADPLNGRRIFEVADEFCFNDAAEFSRAFRREFGYAPSDLRAGNRGASSLHRPSLRLANELADLLKRI